MFNRNSICGKYGINKLVLLALSTASLTPTAYDHDGDSLVLHRTKARKTQSNKGPLPRKKW